MPESGSHGLFAPYILTMSETNPPPTFLFIKQEVTTMKKLIIGTMLAVGLCCADTQHTWESAQRFNDTVLRKIVYESCDYQVCEVTAIRETSFVVRCDINKYLIKLPYTWGEWKIVSSSYAVVVYSNEY